MSSVVVLSVQLRVENDHVLTTDVDELFIRSFVVLGLPVVERILYIVNSYPVNPLHHRIKFLLLLLILQKNVVIFYDIQKTFINLHF